MKGSVHYNCIKHLYKMLTVIALCYVILTLNLHVHTGLGDVDRLRFPKIIFTRGDGQCFKPLYSFKR